MQSVRDSYVLSYIKMSVDHVSFCFFHLTLMLIPDGPFQGQQSSFCVPSYSKSFHYLFICYSFHLCHIMNLILFLFSLFLLLFILSHLLYFPCTPALSLLLFLGTIVFSEFTHRSFPGPPFSYENHFFLCSAYVPEAGDSMFLQNICTYLPNYMTSQCKRQ
jgi:hypothetical protein